MGMEWSERAVASGGQAVRRSAKDNPLVGKFAETQTISATEGRTVSQKITPSGIQDVDSFLGIENAAIYVLKLTTGFPLSSQENLDGSLQNGHQHLEWRKAEPCRRVKDIALTSPSMYLMLSILSTIFVIAWAVAACIYVAFDQSLASCLSLAPIRLERTRLHMVSRRSSKTVSHPK